MAVVEQHVSSDGLLTLLVELVDGDWIVGFDGFAWHTHGDILAAGHQTSPRDAIRTFVDAVVNSQSVIAVSRVGGVIRDIWITDRPADESKYAGAKRGD